MMRGERATTMGLLVVFLVAAGSWCESIGQTMSTSSSSSSSSQSVSDGANGVVYTVVQKTSNPGDPSAIVTVTKSSKPIDGAAFARATEKDMEDMRKKMAQEMSAMQRQSQEMADSINKEVQNSQKAIEDSFKKMSSSFFPFRR